MNRIVQKEQDSSNKQGSSNKQVRSRKQDSSNKNVRSRKQDSSNKQDRASKQDSSNKQDISKNQVRSSKQDSSNKQARPSKRDFSSNNLIDNDPTVLFDKLREFLGKPVKSESDVLVTKMIIVDLLRSKSITRKQYNDLCEKLGLTQIWNIFQKIILFRIQNRVYCSVCNKSYIANSYPNHLESQDHINDVLKDHCTNSTIVKTQFIKK